MEQSLFHLLLNSYKKYPHDAAYAEKENGNYHHYNYESIFNQVKSLAKALIHAGIEENDRVALMSSNCIKWALIDYASLSVAAADVPIYPNLLSSHIEYICQNSGAKLLFAQNDEIIKKIVEIDFSKTSLIQVIAMDNKHYDHPKIIRYDDFVAQGTAVEDSEWENRIALLNPSKLATLIYTSGTTGLPKGVMLSHENILDNIHNSLLVLPISHSDSMLSFLPLSHILERMAGHYLPMRTATKIAFAENIDTVAQNMQEVKPTVMISVPRLYEKIYARVLDSVEKGSPLKRIIFNWAISVGKEVAGKFVCNGKEPKGLLAFKFKIANALVFSKLKERVGGRLRYFISGGGALNAQIAEFFASAGLIVLEGYGLTETSPVITVNRPEKFKFGYVGPPIPNVLVKIAEDGEILAKGKNIMMGYYNNEAATKETIDEHGWFHTGDIGEFDHDGFLKITDRKKDILVTSGGKNVAPLPIESALISSKYIDQAVLIGDKRKFISAIIVASPDAVKDYAKSKGFSKDWQDLIHDSKIRQLFDEEIAKVNKNLAQYESIKKYILKADPFTIESGEMTPKLSIKKKEVFKNYAQEIDDLYEE